jgi:hypothetical protein
MLKNCRLKLKKKKLNAWTVLRTERNIFCSILVNNFGNTVKDSSTT